MKAQLKDMIELRHGEPYNPQGETKYGELSLMSSRTS